MTLNALRSTSQYRHSRYIPDGATPQTRGGIDAVVYWYTLKTGRPGAVAYHGNAVKSDWHFRFRSEESRHAKTEEHFAHWQAHTITMQERAEKRKTYRHTLKIGDVLKASWGYDQTNIDYWEVTAVIGSQTVELRKIGSISHDTGWLQGECVPAPGRYLGEPMRKRVTEGNCVKFASYKYAWPVKKQTIPGVEGVQSILRHTGRRTPNGEKAR